MLARVLFRLNKKGAPLRAAAGRTLIMLDEEKIAPYLDEITEDCRIEVNGWKRKV
ncbi:hypothetical protein PF66_02142 [Pseudomonas asplenii]|uniref:Uncharacterized protein n=1 Tax=Pseudomonas asplenii TaxID=53407 RepID=A0A0N0E4G3_9PSED|nr:hypothetical protein [Pseudomonas fuscovaginae]KPA91259.1 hypothetical protein PF66_02142 [Pseudomonas fuscovaginae]